MVEVNLIDPFSAYFGIVIVENILIFHPQIFAGDTR